MIDISDVKPGMPVVCSKGGQFAVIDHMDGESTIKLKKDDAGMHHFMPISWVEVIRDGEVRVNRPGPQAMREWWTSPREQPAV